MMNKLLRHLVILAIGTAIVSVGLFIMSLIAIVGGTLIAKDLVTLLLGLLH
jgi:hypothetical protein